jgi:hypothetical protein
MRVIQGMIVGGRCAAGVRNGTISTGVMNVKDVVRAALKGRMGVVVKELVEEVSPIPERPGSVGRCTTVREEDFKGRKLRSLN